MSRKILLMSSLALFALLLSVLMFGPAVTPAQAQEPAPAVTCESDVVVQPVDSLSKLAAKFYGDPKAFIVIFNATNQAAKTDSSYATLTDPNVIEDGSKLCIPSAADAQTMIAATPAVTSTAAVPGAPVWPTTLETPTQNPCQQCLCPDILNDGEYAIEQILAPTRGYHYSELFLTCPGQEKGAIFNTTLYNQQAANSRDSLPQALFQNYSDVQATAEYSATSVWLEPARVWTHDKFRIYRGPTVRNFAGLDTAWGAYYQPAPSGSSGANPTFQPTNVTRNSTFWYDAGKPVWLLDAPNGNTYVLQSVTDQSGGYDGLDQLSSKLTLPEGWTFRTETLSNDLTINGITADDGTENMWNVVQDNFYNSYSACWQNSAGDSSCNFKP